MAKSRNEVQQLGMWDDEVGSVKHDEICLWAYRNADEILRSVMPDLFDRPWDLTAEVGISSQEVSVAPARPLLDEFLAKNWRPNPRVVAKSIEPVLSCRIPDDCIDSKRYPLFIARAVLRELIESLEPTGSVKP